MTDYKWMKDEICVNADCLYVRITILIVEEN